MVLHLELLHQRAYQFEGAVNEGNKGDSIWDTFTRRPGRIMDFSNADTTVDHYHRFKVTIKEACYELRKLDILVRTYISVN
ncbi:hypothetical protein IFM89_033843 [Coptis chinensis]|uniref:Beta-glucosidase n=1 Tax=Coptis chinensis TaxID=261450 RepID=A0A835HTU3_9MAGN|nr:hypothetical protein IFM89_033843 [Coptis chinensis]